MILLALLLIVLFLWVSSQQKNKALQHSSQESQQEIKASQQKIKALEKQIKELNKQNEENAIECSNGNNRS